MGTGRVLVWFRADLRVEDNTALFRASQAASRGVVGVFLIAPEQWREHDWAGVKVEFILRTLRELGAALGRLNIPLLIRTVPWFADAPRELLAIAKEFECDALYFNDEYEVNERGRDDAAAVLFEKTGLRVKRFTDNVLVEPGRVRTGEGRYFTVFTPFKRALYKHLTESPIQVLGTPKRQAATDIESSPIPSSIAEFTSTVDPHLWPAGERAARKRLDEFIERSLTSYKDQRDFPATDGTSTLSAYLTVGAISPRACLTAAMTANRGKFEGGRVGSDTWISELAWREFYKHILVGYPRVSMGRAFKPETERVRWSGNDDHFRAWCEGRTGVPIVDAAMRQLLQTGWMHNRARMITAMYLSKDLFLDWRRGERWFMQHLIDGDLAANNGGWQWSASTGTDAAPYFRIFNPVSQSRRFDPDGAYIRRYVPELASLEPDFIHDPSEMPPLLRASIDYPAPIVNHSEARKRAIDAFRAIRP